MIPATRRPRPVSPMSPPTTHSPGRSTGSPVKASPAAATHLRTLCSAPTTPSHADRWPPSSYAPFTSPAPDPPSTTPPGTHSKATSPTWPKPTSPAAATHPRTLCSAPTTPSPADRWPPSSTGHSGDHLTAAFCGPEMPSLASVPDHRSGFRDRLARARVERDDSAGCLHATYRLACHRVGPPRDRRPQELRPNPGRGQLGGWEGGRVG